MRLTFVLSLLALPALAEETVVTIPTEAGDIVGTLALPEGTAEAPVVLMLHGFTGTRDEMLIEGTEQGVFARTAEALMAEGYASLRIDFIGSGESAGNWADTTFSSQTRDALAAIDWLEGQAVLDPTRLAVLGWSQGGLVAAQVAAQSEVVDSLVLWAPVTDPLDIYANIFGEAPLAAAVVAEADAPVTLSLPWGGDTTLNGAFFDEMDITRTVDALADYAGPAQIVMGLNDTIVTPQPGAGEILQEAHAGRTELFEMAMDHAFNAASGPDTLDIEMLPQLVRFLDESL